MNFQAASKRMDWLLQTNSHETKVNIIDAKNCRKLFSELQGMEVDENEGDIGARLRPIFCSMGEITRADGSVMLCQVVLSVFSLSSSIITCIIVCCLGRHNCSLQCFWARGGTTGKGAN